MLVEWCVVVKLKIAIEEFMVLYKFDYIIMKDGNLFSLLAIPFLGIIIT